MRFGPAVLALTSALAASGAEEPAHLRERFISAIRTELERLPDFVCTQNIERFSRQDADHAWQKTDTLRFDVAFVGEHELYSIAGVRGFQSHTPAALAHRGLAGTGQLALLAKHVFLTSSVQLTYKGETEEGGRPAYEYAYDIPAARSSYHLRSNAGEAVVAFQGVFWIDRDTLDLIRLEVQPYDIPAKLGIAELETVLDYSRVAIDGVGVLLPVEASLSVVANDGQSSLNRTRLKGCRHYRSESTIRFAADAAPVPPEAERPPAPVILPHGTLLELTLDSNLDPATARIGDRIRATLVRPVKSGETILVPQGVPVSGHLIRLEKTTMPFPIYQIGLQFEALELAGNNVPLRATMIDAGPSPGLLRQSKRLEPTFTKKRDARIGVLVREIQRGEGLLSWDERQAPVPRGLRMKWRVQADDPSGSEAPQSSLHPQPF